MAVSLQPPDFSSSSCIEPRRDNSMVPCVCIQSSVICVRLPELDAGKSSVGNQTPFMLLPQGMKTTSISQGRAGEGGADASSSCILDDNTSIRDNISFRSIAAAISADDVFEAFVAEDAVDPKDVECTVTFTASSSAFHPFDRCFPVLLPPSSSW